MSNLTLDPTALVETINRFEADRMNKATTIANTALQRNRFDSPLARSVSTDRRELAAMALARSQGAMGPSISQFQTQEAQRALEEQRMGAATLGQANQQAIQSSQQQAGLAIQGAQQQVQESAALRGQGLDMMAQDSRFNMIKDIKDRELATSLATMFLQNEGRQLGRKARMTAASRGIQAQEYENRLARESQQRNRAVAGVATLFGTGLAAADQAGLFDPRSPEIGSQTQVSIAGESPINATVVGGAGA